MQTLPRFGHDITLALSGLEEALVPVLAACRHYDGYVETAISHLHAVARPPEDPPQPHVAPPTRAARPSLRLPGLTTQCQLLRRSSPQVVRPGSCSRGSAIQESTDST